MFTSSADNQIAGYNFNYNRSIESQHFSLENKIYESQVFHRNTHNNDYSFFLDQVHPQVSIEDSTSNLNNQNSDEIISINPESRAVVGGEVSQSWIGNSFDGKDSWVQMDISSLDVTPEGKVFTNSVWDEAGREAGIYQEGKVIGLADATHGWGRKGGLAVATSKKYLYLSMEQNSIKNHKQEDYPQAGETWYVVRRYNHRGKPAPFAGGRGYDHSMLIINRQEKVSGLAVYEDKLYISDPSKDLVHIYQENFQEMTRLGSISTPNPGAITVDLEENLWIVNQESGEINQYSSWGKSLDKSIKDVVDPTSISIDNQGRLLVAENGPRQQVLIYEVKSSPELVATLGLKGGIYQENPGMIGDDRLYGLSGVDVDDAGNIYVSLNGFNRSGAVLRQYKPNGELSWELLGLEFLDTADVDPYSQGQDVYTKDSHYVINYDDQGQKWRYQAYTVDPFRYPDDPRLHTQPTSIFMRRIDGKKIMFLTDMYAKNLLIYHFEGEIAVPAGIIAKKHTAWPTNQPEAGMWLWLDENGDGHIQADEYQLLHDKNQDVWGWEIDEKGNVWVATRKQGIWQYPFQGFNGHGVPVYNSESAEHMEMPEPFTSIERIEYVTATDTMYLGGYTKDLPKSSGEWGLVGTEIIAYDHWSSEKPNLAWRIQLPHNLDNNHLEIIKAMDIEGDLVFAVSSRQAEVYVYDRYTGSYLTTITPAESGWIDIPYGIRVDKLESGEYIIFVEENAKAKIIMYYVGVTL